MARNNINDNRPSLWQAWKSSSILSLFALGYARPFFSFTHAKSVYRYFAENASKVDRQVMLSAARYKKISSTRFDLIFSTITERVYVEGFRFNRRSQKKIIIYFSWPSTKQRTQLDGNRTISRFAAFVLLVKLATPARWCNLECLFGKFAPQLLKNSWEVLYYFMFA